MTLGEYIKAYRDRQFLSQRQFADKAGVSNGYISMLEKGVNPKTGEPITPSMPALFKIATAMGITVSELCANVDDMAVELSGGAFDYKGVRNLQPIEPHHTIPVLGSIACGTPITAEENVEDYVSAPADLACHFALRCKGDSMAPRILDGDLVYIRKQEDVTDGQIAAVVIDDEATLKHVYHIPGGVQLISDNPSFRPLTYVGETCEGLRIVGLAVAYQRMLV